MAVREIAQLTQSGKPALNFEVEETMIGEGVSPRVILTRINLSDKENIFVATEEEWESIKNLVDNEIAKIKKEHS